MTPLVRIHDLCLHLNGRAILHHVDLELPRHGISVLLGRSGSGKTRFFVKPNLMQMHSSYVVTDPNGYTISR